MTTEKKERYRFIIMILLSIVVGSTVGIVGSLFHMSVDWVEHSKLSALDYFWPFEHYKWLPYVVSSTVMIFIAIHLVRLVAPEARGSGIQEIEGVLEDKREVNAIRTLFVKFFGGMLSLGSGMAMGREGPTVQIGGTLGQLLAETFHLKKDDLKTLIAAGAGAGLATTFNAPLAGILFVFEEMKKQFKYSYTSVQSVITASIVSTIVLYLIMGNYIDIPIKDLLTPQVYDMWIFVIFGIFFGVFGYIFNILLVAFSTFFANLNSYAFNFIILIIGIGIGLLLWMHPESVGQGYDVIHTTLSGTLPLGMLLLLFVVRFFVTMISYGTGAPGGIFAPMLALGVLFGFAFGIIVQELIPGFAIEPAVFAVVGMSALFSATVRAPLTGIVLVAELTMSFSLLLPLLITSLVATITVSAMGGRPIYTILLEKELEIAKFGRKKSNA